MSWSEFARMVNGPILPFTIAVATIGADARANTKVNVESVDNYSLRHGPSLNNSVANGSGFMSAMTQAGSIFTVGQEWRDNNVLDTDFHDNDRSGRPADTDYRYFDTTARPWPTSPATAHRRRALTVSGAHLRASAIRRPPALGDQAPVGRHRLRVEAPSNGAAMAALDSYSPAASMTATTAT